MSKDTQNLTIAEREEFLKKEEERLLKEKKELLEAQAPKFFINYKKLCKEMGLQLVPIIQGDPVNGIKLDLSVMPYDIEKETKEVEENLDT